MLSRTILRSVRTSTLSVRSFSVASVARKDFVQDLYLKELKAYKPNPAAADHAGAVKSYSTPASPIAPATLDAAALAKELDAYDAEIISTSEEAPHSSTAHASEETSEGADEFLSMLEKDVHVEGKH